jgi:hypothetical protein
MNRETVSRFEATILARLSRPPALAVLGALALGLFVGVNTLEFTGTVPYFKRISGGSGIPDMQPYYDAARAHQLLSALGASGRHAHAILLATFDVVFPAVVAVFLRSAMAALYRGTPPRGLRLAPWVSMMLDYAENIACGILVATYPAEPVAIATLAGILTAAKNIAYATALLTVLAGIALAIARSPGAPWNRRGGGVNERPRRADSTTGQTRGASRERLRASSFGDGTRPRSRRESAARPRA